MGENVFKVLLKYSRRRVLSRMQPPPLPQNSIFPFSSIAPSPSDRSRAREVALGGLCNSTSKQNNMPANQTLSKPVSLHVLPHSLILHRKQSKKAARQQARLAIFSIR
jgi:hypothetical protein